MATAAMDLIGAIDAIDDIRLSGTKEEDWFVESAKQAMENGRMLYAGKYSAPDYELILSNDCSLTIANTMIYHNPQAKEKLEALGIPVLVERSSYEEHPLGRLEWIKVYGALYGKEQEADEFYNESLKRIEPIMEKSKTDKTVAFFYVNANGAINVRKPADYVSKMITLSGGNYVPDKVTTEENAMSTMNMQMEDFYIEAKDADILIYNATIGGEIRSIGELIAKNPLFADFAAVRNKQVYCTTQQMFQQSTHVAGMMEDFHKIIQNEPENLIYLTHVE